MLALVLVLVLVWVMYYVPGLASFQSTAVVGVFVAFAACLPCLACSVWVVELAGACFAAAWFESAAAVYFAFACYAA